MARVRPALTPVGCRTAGRCVTIIDVADHQQDDIAVRAERLRAAIRDALAAGASRADVAAELGLDEDELANLLGDD